MKDGRQQGEDPKQRFRKHLRGATQEKYCGAVSQSVESFTFINADLSEIMTNWNLHYGTGGDDDLKMW